jgi:hypothetical protein
MSVPLHLGVGHPVLLWIVVAGVLSFTAGTGVGLYYLRQRVRGSSDAEPAGT